MSADTQSDERRYDLIVVGAGPVGENVADAAVKRGLRTAIVEAELVGGECSYWACMPSKALLRSAEALRAARRVDGARQAVHGGPDVEAVLARRTAFTSDWNDAGQVEWLQSAGIDLIRGRARIVGERAIEVDGERHEAAHIALATGSVPVIADIAGLADAAPWTTRDATGARSLPASLLVIGGGVAGSELATAYASLGVQVTLVATGTLLSREEAFAGELVAASLRELGVDLHLGVAIERVTRDEHGRVTTELGDGRTVSTDEILVTTGRRPSTSDLGLESVGLEPDAPIEVDDTMLVTGTDWLSAVGDVNGRALLTHQGKYQARAAGEAIAALILGTPVHDEPWGAHVATADHAAVPSVVFTDPEVASVGLTEARARALELPVRAVDVELGGVAGAALRADGYEGKARLVVDTEREVVVGATFVGQDVAEMLHAATIAVVGEVPLSRLWHAVPAYPTMSEAWLRLLEAYGRPD